MLQSETILPVMMISSLLTGTWKEIDGLTRWLYCQDDSRALNSQCFKFFHRMRALGSKRQCFSDVEKKKRGWWWWCTKSNQIWFNPRLTSDFFVSSDTSSCSSVWKLNSKIKAQSFQAGVLL